MWAYYNEIDDFAADTIENLISAGHVAPGVVDRRSIEDVSPEDLRGFTQCHFFAGIAVWSLGLRRAGWPDDRPAWSGSCPCQPFSSAGKGGGFDDERHLWPAFFHLIRECRPPVVFGEQVASSHVNPWVELVQDDLEGVGYRFGAVPFPSAGVGAPHIRDRTFWVADSGGATVERDAGRVPGAEGSPADGGGDRYRHGGETGRLADSSGERFGKAGGGSLSTERAERAKRNSGLGGLADSDRGQQHGVSEFRGTECNGANAGRTESGSEPQSCGVSGRVADSNRVGRGQIGRHPASDRAAGKGGAGNRVGDGSENGEPSRMGGPWDNPEWLYCRDGKWRPVEPGTFPLAHGLARGMGSLDAGLLGLADVAGADAASLRRAKSYRVGALRAYGNAINAFQAEQFIRAYMDV